MSASGMSDGSWPGSPSTSLNEREPAFRAEWDEHITEGIAELDFESEFTASAKPGSLATARAAPSFGPPGICERAGLLPGGQSQPCRKVTLATRVLQPQTHLPIANAVMIVADGWSVAESEHVYEAARTAEATRQELIRASRPFTTETVFSHPSKVELAVQTAESGYLVYMHVVVVPVEVTIDESRTECAMVVMTCQNTRSESGTSASGRSSRGLARR